MQKPMGYNIGGYESKEDRKKAEKNIKQARSKEGLRSFLSDAPKINQPMRKERYMEGRKARHSAFKKKLGRTAAGIASSLNPVTSAVGLIGKVMGKESKKRDFQKGDYGDISVKKMGGGMMKKYSEGMSYKDMAPYGGKYAKIKKDMRDKASENVKRLTTQSSAYDPETRYVTAEQRKGNSRRRQVKKTTDQVYLKGVANKMKEDMGSNTRTSILTPSQASERGIIRPKRRRGLSISATLSRIKDRLDRPTGSQKELLDRRPPRKISTFNMGGMMKPSGYRTGTMVKARGCKLGRTRPTKIT